METFRLTYSDVFKRREEMLSTLLSKPVQKAQELPEAIQLEGCLDAIIAGKPVHFLDGRLR